MIDGISPYSDEVAVRIQTRAYGRPAQAGEHELRVAYPLYSTTIFLPFSLISEYDLARAVWMTTLEVGLLALAILSLRLTNWKPGLGMLAIYLLFSLTWYHSVRALINGNAVILVALMMVGVLAAIKEGRDELAGILLALATIKPQVVVVFLVFVWVWAFSAGRRIVVLWTVIGVVFLSIGAALFVPDWPLQNLMEVLRYPGYNPPGTPGAALATWWPAAGEKLGWGLTAILAILLLIEWAAARGKDFHWFAWTAGLTLVASQWIGIQTDPGNFIVLLMPLILILAKWKERAGPKAGAVILVLMAVPWVGLWYLFLRTVDFGEQPQQHPIMFFPLPTILFIGLYWVRWWATRPVKLLVDG